MASAVIDIAPMAGVSSSNSGSGMEMAVTNLPDAFSRAVSTAAFAAVFYLGSPLTIPGSLVVGWALSLSQYWKPERGTPREILQNALLVYLWPLVQAQDAISQLFNPTASATEEPPIAVPVAAESSATVASANLSGESAVESKGSLVTATASTAALPSPSGAATAAATTFGPVGDFVYDLARSVAQVVALALVPLWWIGAPITLPLGFALGEVLFPNDDWGLFPNMGNFITAIAAPYALVSALLPDRAFMRSPSAAAVRPASARSKVAGKTADSPAPVKRAAAVRSSGKAKAAVAVSKRSPARTVSR